MLNLTFTHLQIAAAFTKIGWVDVVALILIAWGVIAGFRKGLEAELPKFLEISIATVLALHYYKTLGELLHLTLSAPVYPAEILSFFVISLTTIVMIRLFFKLMAAVVTVKFMPAISRIGGAVFGTVKFMLVMSLMAYFLLMLPLDFFKSSFSSDRSWSGPFFEQTSEKYYRFAAYYWPFKLPEVQVAKPQAAGG